MNNFLSFDQSSEVIYQREYKVDGLLFRQRYRSRKKCLEDVRLKGGEASVLYKKDGRRCISSIS